MIWDRQTENSPADSFRRAAEEELATLCPDLAEQPEWLYSTTQLLMELCGRWYPSFHVPADHYGLLLAQLLWMMNRTEEANASLRRWCSPEVALLCRPGISMDECRGRLVLHESGVVRGAVWACMGPGRGWIIDLSRICSDGSMMLELTISALLRTVISRVAWVWYASSGEGWVGLRGIGRVSGSRTRWRGGRAEADQELCRYSEGVLRHLAMHRGWSRVPDVKNLTI